MERTQWWVVMGAVVVWLGMYLACDTRTADQRKLDQVRTLNAEATDVATLKSEAHGDLSPAQLATIGTLEERLQQSSQQDSSHVNLLEQLSGQWYEAGHPAIAGAYAQDVAELRNTAQDWAITGTTYAICVQRATADKVKAFCSKRAIKAFESAISLDPDNVDNRINLALTYTDTPPADNPMKGVMMLRELQEKHPDNPQVLISLARLAIQTGQYQRAIQRLQQALSMVPNDRSANCLMAEAYRGLGDQALERSYAERCQQPMTTNDN